MKKGKKLLAGFLAFVMVATSFAWNFGEVKVAEAADVDVENQAYVEYDFMNMTDTSVLNSDFTSYKQGAEADANATDSWFVGKEAEGADKSNREGLKSKKKGDMYYLMHNNTYKNFWLTVKINPDANLCIVVGDVGTTGPATQNSGACQFWTSGSSVSTINYQGAGQAQNTTSLKWSGNKTELTLNIRVENRKLTAWVEETGVVKSFEVNTAFPEQSRICLRQKRNTGTGSGVYGCYQSLKIRDLDASYAEGYYDFENVNTTNLIDFTSTQFDKTSKEIIGEANQLVSSQWYSGKSGTLQVDESTSVAHTSTHWGLKPLADTDNTYNHFLNYKGIYKNFKCSTELYFESNQGIVIGEANAYPSATASNAIILWTTGNNTIAIQGGIKGNTAKVSGENAGWSGNGSGTYNFKFSPANPTVGANFKINIKLEDNILYVSIEGYDAQLQIEVKDDFPTDVKVALWSRNYVTDCARGFKSFEFKDLDNKVVFSESGIDNLTDFTASMRNKSTGEYIKTNVKPSEVWYTGTSKTSASGVENTSTNAGLKALADSSTDNSYDHYLYYNDSYKNYKATIQLRKQGNIGLMIGEQNVHPTSSSAETAIMIWFPDKTFALQGALDWSDYRYIENGVEKSTDSSNNQRNIKYADSSPADGTLLTIEIEMKDGYLSISTGYSSLKVRVSSSFPREGSLGLWNRNYKSNKGGFESFAIREVQVNTGTTVDVEQEDGSRYTDFEHVNVSVLDKKGFSATQFDMDDAFAVVKENQTVSTYWAAGQDVYSANPGLKPNTLESDKKMSVLNTPYEYDGFYVSTEVYWGANTGIVMGEENVFSTPETDTAVRVYFNGDQLQILGKGVDYDTVHVTGGTSSWNPNYLVSNGVGIFKPASDFKPTTHKGEVYQLNIEYIDGIFTIWVGGIEGSLTIKASDAFCDVESKKIALMSRGYNGDCGGFKSLTVKELDDIVVSYSAEEFATYRSKDGHKAPVYKNYLFAGWFTDASCTFETAVPSSAMEADAEVVYAKFVPRYILTVKAQVSTELLDDDLTNDQTGKIRFATTVDSENYSQVGFDIAYEKDGVIKKQQKANNTVYSVLNAFGKETYSPKQFCNSSIYFKAVTVKNIGTDYYDVEFNVTPFWKTLDGTRVEGDTVVKTINQGINANFLYGKKALFVGDSIQYGGGDTNANSYSNMAWAGRLERYFGMEVEKVAVSGATLTNTSVSGANAQIKSQLTGVQGTDFDFVLLEGGVNDVRIMTGLKELENTIQWGNVNEDSNASFSDITIAGAIQELIQRTKNAYPNATVVYIINHEFGLATADMKQYVSIVKEACRVHDVLYVDLSDTEAYPTLAPLATPGNEYLVDTHHPNAAGYELTTPVIANYLRKLVTGELTDVVYVASTGTDAKGYGTEIAPYQSLNYAVSRVADGGTIYVKDTLVCNNGEGTTNFSLDSNGFESGKNIESATNVIDKVNYKQVTIAGANENAKLDFSGLNNVFFNESVILEDIQVAWPSRIRAEGNTLIIKDTIEQVGTEPGMLIGGSHYHNLEKTDLRIYGGTYKCIVGGQQKHTVGETNVIVGGKVNENVDLSDHTFGYVLYGGCYSEGAQTQVCGDTHITVEEGAKFRYIYGGGTKTATPVPTVGGETYVTVKGGNVMSVFGGDYKIPCGNTNVKILGGTIDQVFGGSESASASGDINIELLGGEIRRRVYGGCYNDFKKYGTLNYQWVADHDGVAPFSVSGDINITIGPNANLSLNISNDDRGVFGGSRYKKAIDDGTATIIFLDGCRSSKESLLGRKQDDYEGFSLGSPKVYDQIIEKTTN